MNADDPETESRRGRVPIWSVLEEDQRLYSWLFPGLWLAGTLYHAYLRFRIEPESHILLTVGEFTKDMGIVGLSAAIVALMLIAGRRFMMALFDWGNREKTRRIARAEGRIEGRTEGLAEGRTEGLAEGRTEGLAEGRTEGMAEERQAWMVWLRKRDEAHARGEDFNEPSPAERAKESQVA